LTQFERVLHGHAGSTPVLVEAITASAIGRLNLNGGKGVRVDAALPGLLRSLPGVRAVKVAMSKPWAT
jgi:DNA polymerase-3 subunit alpha